MTIRFSDLEEETTIQNELSKRSFSMISWILLKITTQPLEAKTRGVLHITTKYTC